VGAISAILAPIYPNMFTARGNPKDTSVPKEIELNNSPNHTINRTIELNIFVCWVIKFVVTPGIIINTVRIAGNAEGDVIKPVDPVPDIPRKKAICNNRPTGNSIRKGTKVPIVDRKSVLLIATPKNLTSTGAINRVDKTINGLKNIYIIFLESYF